MAPPLEGVGSFSDEHHAIRKIIERTRLRTWSIAIALVTAAVTTAGPLTVSASAEEASSSELICLISPTVDSLWPVVGTVVGALGAAISSEPVCADTTLPSLQTVTFDEETGRVATGGAALAAALGLGPERDTFTLGFDYKNPECGDKNPLRWVTEDYQRCNGNSERVFSVRSMPRGWKDNISSAEGHRASGCFTFRHYEHAGFDGARVDCFSCFTMGAMDDHTSSIAFW